MYLIIFRLDGDSIWSFNGEELVPKIPMDLRENHGDEENDDDENKDRDDDGDGDEGDNADGPSGGDSDDDKHERVGATITRQRSVKVYCEEINKYWEGSKILPEGFWQMLEGVPELGEVQRAVSSLCMYMHPGNLTKC